MGSSCHRPNLSLMPSPMHRCPVSHYLVSSTATLLLSLPVSDPHLLPAAAAAAAAEPGRSSAPNTVAPGSSESAPQAGSRARGESVPGPAA